MHNPRPLEWRVRHLTENEMHLDEIKPENKDENPPSKLLPPLATVEARYKDLLNRLGVQGHEGAIAEIESLRNIAGLDA